jgi:hypothetical protein
VFSDDANDRDGDTLPDDWEIENFGSIAAQDVAGDADDDGITNGREHIFDTDPTDPASRMEIAIFPFGTTNSIVQWPSSADRNYRVQTSPSLADGTWIDVGGVRTGTGSSMSEIVSTAGGTQHFRVLVELP